MVAGINEAADNFMCIKTVIIVSLILFLIFNGVFWLNMYGYLEKDNIVIQLGLFMGSLIGMICTCCFCCTCYCSELSSLTKII